MSNNPSFRHICLTAFLAIFGLTTLAPRAASRQAGECWVYFGTYTGAKSKGVYVSKLDLMTGSLTPPQLAAESTSPSFLALHPSGRFLYAVNEVGSFRNVKSGAVSAWAIDRATGQLTLLNQESSIGGGPCHIVVDKQGRHALVANYGGGSTTVLGLAPDGRLAGATSFVQHQGGSVNLQRQEAPHAHCVTLDKSNRHALVADLGLDKMLVFDFDKVKGVITANDPPSASVKSGAGPRHFAFTPNHKFGYVINELDCTMTAFRYDARAGALQELQTLSTLRPGEIVQPGYSTAEVAAHPSGKFLYGSNRGHNTIVVYAIHPRSGELALVQHQSTLGKIPRSFGIDPTGRWLLAANQDSDTVVVFGIDRATGRLAPTGRMVDMGAPVCVKFLKL